MVDCLLFSSSSKKHDKSNPNSKEGLPLLEPEHGVDHAEKHGVGDVDSQDRE